MTEIPPFKETDEDFEFLGCHVFSYKGTGRNVLLNRKVGTTIFVDDELLRTIHKECLSDDLRFKLIQRGFAKTSYSPEIQSTSSIILPTFFIVDLTNACNLRCSYCFRKYSQDSNPISDYVLDNICDYIISYCKEYNQKQITIQPWGGEPLLALSKIRRIQDNFHKAGYAPRITIETNGILLTSKIVNELFQRKISVSVSIDGISDVHDRQRVLINGKGSFSSVYRGIANLQNSGYGNNFGTISVVTTNTLEYLEETLDYFAKELRLSSIKLNIVKGNLHADETNLSLSSNEIIYFVSHLLGKLIELHKKGTSITEGNILEKLCNVLIRRDRNICISRGCVGGKRMVSFNKEGQIFPCELTDYSEEMLGTIGDDDDLVVLIKKAIEKSNYFSVKSIDECDSCPWWYYCRGGCTSSIIYKSGLVSGVDSTECLVNKTLYPELLKLIITEPEITQGLSGEMVKISWGKL